MAAPLNHQVPELTAPKSPTLRVHSIWETIQGEGPFAGTPSVFVRLAGCNLQCPACDTDYTSESRLMTPGEVIREVEAKATGHNRLVVITGGEPFRQHLNQLLIDMHEFGFKVQIETNGVLPHRLDKDAEFWDALTIVCSPKTFKINRENELAIKHFKYVLDADSVSSIDGLPTSSLGYEMLPYRPAPVLGAHLGLSIASGKTIYVQPIDVGDAEENKRHTAAAVESCLKFGYRLCLQMHKIIGLP